MEPRHHSRLFYVERRKTASIRARKSALYVKCGECKQHGSNILQMIRWYQLPSKSCCLFIQYAQVCPGSSRFSTGKESSRAALAEASSTCKQALGMKAVVGGRQVCYGQSRSVTYVMATGDNVMDKPQKISLSISIIYLCSAPSEDMKSFNRQPT